MLVPHSDCANELDTQYKDVRDNVAIEKDDLLVIEVPSGQPCSRFGMHPNMKALQKMYQDGGRYIFCVNIQ